MGRKRFYSVWFVFHFAVLFAVSARETVWLLARDLTISPLQFKGLWHKAEEGIAAGVGEDLPNAHPIRQILSGYEHATGIESGYGFFAPNVTNSHRLVFELHYSDGHVEYDVPSVQSEAGGLRLASLLDKLEQTEDDNLRQIIITMLVEANWREHAGVEKVRALFGDLTLPTVDDFEHGAGEVFQPTYEYGFAKKKAPAAGRQQ